MDKETVQQKILSKVIGFLSYRARTRKEIELRLGRYFNSVKDIDEKTQQEITQKIIEYLEDNKLINDEEFIKLFIESKTRGKKALGKKAIENKLIAKGINKEDAGQRTNAAIKEEDELKAAIGLIDKKFSSAIDAAKSLGKDYKSEEHIKDKMGRYLLSRGFSYSTSREAVDYLLKRP